ncbi:hypothetical protein [Emticicia fontis]
MLRYLPVLIFLFLLSCKTSNEVIEQKNSCFLEKSTQENGEDVNTITYDAKHRPVSFSAANKKNNFTITYNEANNTSLMKSYLFGEIAITYTPDKKIANVSSGNGKFEFKYDAKNISEINFESSSTPIINSRSKLTNFRFEYTGENVSKVFMNNGNAIKNFLVFEGIQYDNKKSIFPQEIKEYWLITTILNYIVISYTLDFSSISKNNALSIKAYNPSTAVFENYQYNYSYNSNDYPIQIQYKLSNNSIMKYNYTYSCF